MGRNNKNYHRSLVEQAYDRLVSMQHFGESKAAAKKDGTDKDKIFSISTYKTYYKHCKYFCHWIQENHPECTTLKSAKKYVNDWLEYRTNVAVNQKGESLSAWTIQLEAKAMGKLYGIDPADESYFQPPKRERKEIKRSRGSAERDKHFSERNNDELIRFCRGTGLRRGELEKLQPEYLVSRKTVERRLQELLSIPEADRTVSDLKKIGMCRDTELFPDTEYFLWIRGKGGRQRLSPIIGPDAQKIIARIAETPKGKKVWEYVNSNADIHSYRAEYATRIYKQFARDIDKIPYDSINKGTGKKYQSDVYVCRKDEVGKKLDKRAMLVASKALGHNRISIVADNYLRNL